MEVTNHLLVTGMTLQVWYCWWKKFSSSPGTYKTLNGINYYCLSTGAKVSSINSRWHPNSWDPGSTQKIYIYIRIYNHDSRSPTFYLAHGGLQVVTQNLNLLNNHSLRWFPSSLGERFCSLVAKKKQTLETNACSHLLIWHRVRVKMTSTHNSDC